jgi:hypothetical protein
MTAGQLRRILKQGRKLRCAKCQIPKRTCRAISNGLWGEEVCILRIVLKEILVFHCKHENSQLKKKGGRE